MVLKLHSAQTSILVMRVLIIKHEVEEMVLELNADNFEKETSEGWGLVDFWAPWCGPCKRMGPVFEELSEEYSGKVKFAKVNTEDNSDVAGEHDISGIPCLIMFKDGEEVDRFVGAFPKDSLKEKIDGAIK